MRAKIAGLFNDRGREIGRLYVVLFGANVLAWAWALFAFHDRPLQLGTAILSYTFGLQHGLDADHIAAIDNVTRKLLQDGKSPVAAGFFFALGHSTLVALACAAVALASTALVGRVDGLKALGGPVGTLVSALFLFLIAAANIAVLRSIYQSFLKVRRGASVEDVDRAPAQSGILGRFFHPAFRMIRYSWQMYPLGLLFALGFDTAIAIGFFGVSATEATRNLPAWSIMVFPALFAAAMTLVDTTDGVLMLGAYGWAFKKPVRKLYYNLTITLISVLIAVLVGGIQVLGLVAERMDLDGPFWTFVDALNGHFASLGGLIIGIFALSWLVSIAVYRLGRFDELEHAA